MNIQNLKLITEALSRHQISYTLGGSGLLYYLGLVDHVNDWDLLVECPKEKLCEALGAYALREQSSGEYPFASKYRIQVLPPFNIDVIGFFTIESAQGKLEIPLEAGSIWQGISVSQPEIWYAAYKMMGRESKAELLYQYLKKEEKNKRLILQLAAASGLDESTRQALLLLLE